MQAVADHHSQQTAGVVPFLLESDKSWIEVIHGSGNEEEQGNSTDPQFKPLTGSLYMVAKELQKLNGGKDIALTSHGKLIPVSGQAAGGKHGYQFEYTPGHPNFKAFDFYISHKAEGKEKLLVGNAFKQLATRKGISGAAQWMFRFAWDPHNSRLTARKPYAIVTQDVRLDKGRPVKIAWITV